MTTEAYRYCRYCRQHRPVDRFGRTPTGLCKRRCLSCEAKRTAAEAGKWTAYHAAYQDKVRARKAARIGKWLAYAMGDEQAVDWEARTVTEVRRVTIAKGGTVKLKGQPTRWLVELNEGYWTIYLCDAGHPPNGSFPRFADLWCSFTHRHKARSYLDNLSDNDLLTVPPDLAKRTLSRHRAEA